MYRIERRFGGTWDTYPVFTVAEAKKRGLTVVDWPLVDVGEWGRTDDGYVMRCHDIYEMEKRKGYSLQFKFTTGRPIAQFYDSGGGPREVHRTNDFEFLDYLRTGGYQFSKAQTWQQREAKKTRTERACQAWAQFWILRDGELQDSDWATIGRTYRTDEAVPEPGATAKRLFNEPEIQRKAMATLAELVVDAGESPEDVVEKYNELFEETVEGDADEKEVALDVADRLRDMLNMNPDRRPEPNSADAGMDSLLGHVEEQEAEVQSIEDADTTELPEPNRPQSAQTDE